MLPSRQWQPLVVSLSPGACPSSAIAQPARHSSARAFAAVASTELCRLVLTYRLVRMVRSSGRVSLVRAAPAVRPCRPVPPFGDT